MISRWSAQIEIDKICDRYEEDWRSGCSQPLDNYLTDFDAPVRSQLFQELVLVDRELRSSNAETPTWDEYRTCFPAFAKEVEALRFKWELSTNGSKFTAGSDSTSSSHLARFQLLETIGSGAGGVVWKALDPRLNRHIAIKLPHAARHWEAAELSRFFREARAVAKLAHPNIVPIYEIDQFASRPYIVSALIDGQDLRILLGSTKMTPERAAKLCREAAGALQHAHDHGVIHRDVKPSNILVDQLGSPFVTDFGLAKDLDHDATTTMHGVIMGIPAYMSPEQASAGAAVVDHRTDVYGLGVVLYEMLTQRRPFSNQPHSLVSTTPRPDPPRPRSIDRGVPHDLESICLKAIETRPEARYQSAAELAEDLQRFLSGEPVKARGYGPIATAWRNLKRHPARLAIVGLLVLTATAASAAGFLAQQNDELRGMQMVEITSDPPGATLAVVPLDDVTYEPDVDRRRHLHGTTPFSKKLAPGNYLIVAALPDGRFHEVYRHVPKDMASLPAGYGYLYWDVTEDGSIKLPPIVIPPLDTAEQMALVTQDDSSFYVDCHEFTVGEYQAFSGHLPNDLNWQTVPVDHAVTVSFHEAVVIAERSGKRLPTAREYGIALAHCSVGDKIPAQSTAQSALTLYSDATKTSPPILGLRSNVAEWTMTRPSRVAVGRDEEPLPIAGLALFQIVQPGNLGPTDQEYGLNETRHVTAIRPQYLVSPDLGFRCVRSAKPRFIEQ